MDLISLFLFTHETNEIKSPTKIYDFTVSFLFYFPSFSTWSIQNISGNSLLIHFKSSGYDHNY